MKGILYKIFITFVISIFCIALIIGISAVAGYVYLMREGIPGAPIEITIPKGSTAKDVALLLKEKGLIPHEICFLAMLKIKGGDRDVKYGIYSIPQGYSARQIYELILKGPVKLIFAYKITVPEGLTNKQISMITPNPEEFLTLVNSAGYAKEKNIPGPTVEGFLMPGTYFFEEIPDAKTIANNMIDQFEKEWKKLMEENGYDLSPEEKYQKVIIASLVEEEGKVDEERPLIAQVIYNRLKKDMLLQIDATLQYANQKYGVQLTDKDKQIDSPYNTYKYKGLPPTPISNPGIISLRAALFPEAGEYLYFVLNADGKTHVFNKGIDEHVTAVKKYRRSKKK
ncbi:MAG TPA: endolytic transglycosylase MltG [Candidatus Hydrogenedens sp.]|nr:endolytic transglycosylase MltG [Candidatus Hydrogenedens sp.]